MTIDEAQKAIATINTEIASVEAAIAEKKPEEFANYDYWLKGISRKKGYLYQERSFLERWIHQTIDKFDVAGRQRRIDGFAALVQMSRGQFEYTPKFGEGCPADSAPKADHRKQKLDLLASEVSKKMTELTSIGENTFHLSSEAMEEPFRPLKDFVGEIYREIKYLSGFLKASRKKPKGAEATALSVDPGVGQPLKEELEGFWTAHPYQRHFAAGVKPVSDDEPGLRLGELRDLIRAGQLHFGEVWEKAAVEPYELSKEQFRQLASSFSKKMGTIQREMAYLRETYPRLRDAGILPSPTGGNSIQHLHLPMNEIKERVGMNGHDMLLWVVGRIRPGGQLAISKGDVATLAVIHEFAKLVEERIRLEYGPERVKQLLLPK